MWSPSRTDLMWCDKYGELNNIDFDASDIHQYFEIFEKDIGSLKGKDKDKPHDTMSIVDILSEGESGLYCDIFYLHTLLSYLLLSFQTPVVDSHHMLACSHLSYVLSSFLFIVHYDSILLKILALARSAAPTFYLTIVVTIVYNI